MLKIRLQRTGKKNAASYRIVLAEHTSPPKGKFIEILGSYNPRLKQKAFKAERIQHWISKGAQVSPTVHNLLIDEKIIQGEKVKSWKPKKKKGGEKQEVPKVEGETPVEESKEVTEEKPVEPEAPKEEPKQEEQPAKEEKPEKPTEQPEKPLEEPKTAPEEPSEPKPEIVEEKPEEPKETPETKPEAPKEELKPEEVLDKSI